MLNDLNHRRTLLEVYAGLWQRIWQKALPLMGSPATQGLFRQAVQDTAVEYNFLQALPLAEEKVDVATWADRCPDVAVEDLQAGLQALVVYLFGQVWEQKPS